MMEKSHSAIPKQKNANMAIVGKSTNLREAIELNDGSKMKLAMQEEYESLNSVARRP